jgi:hypothetical protein
MVVVTFHIPAFQSYAVIKPHQESWKFTVVLGAARVFFSRIPDLD